MSASVNLKLLKSWLVLDVMNCPQLDIRQTRLAIHHVIAHANACDTRQNLEEMQLMRPESHVNASSEFECVFRCQEQPLRSQLGSGQRLEPISLTHSEIDG